MKLKTNFLTFVAACSLSMGIIAQENSKSAKILYNPDADAKTDISNAIASAKKRTNTFLYRLVETGVDGV